MAGTRGAKGRVGVVAVRKAQPILDKPIEARWNERDGAITFTPQDKDEPTLVLFYDFVRNEVRQFTKVKDAWLQGEFRVPIDPDLELGK
jgi:hypothetical protein